MVIAATHTVFKSNPSPRPFGVGLITHTEADEQWWAENAPSSARAYFAERAAEELWPFDPDADVDDLARNYEQQELAEMGIDPANRGFGFFGHMA